MLSHKSNSLLAKHLSEKVFDQLKDKKTWHGYTLHQAIQSNMENLDSSIGIYAGDEDSYETFSTIFNPVIADYHGVDPESVLYRSGFTDIDLPDLDPLKKNILSTRIRVARNIAGIPFTPHISLADRQKIEAIAVKSFTGLNKGLQGNFFKLTSLSPQQRRCFKTERISFSRGDRFQESAGINRDWPHARGFFMSDPKDFMVWVNEEDHLRIISLQRDGNLSQPFNRLAEGLSCLETKISFAFSPKIGYLTACPSNLGTAMRASVHIRLPRLEKNRELLMGTAQTYNLQIRGTCGEKTDIEDAVFDISNRQRLGITEKECITTLHKGIRAVLYLENHPSTGVY